MTDRTFAQRLQAVIDDDPKLTEAGLAVKAGLDNSTIRGLLAGRVKNPRMDTALKICKALGTTIEEFMSEAQSPTEKEIVRLVMQLPDHLRQELLGYGRALAVRQDQGLPEPGADDQ